MNGVIAQYYLCGRVRGGRLRGKRFVVDPAQGLLAAIRAAFVGEPTVEINGFGGAHYAHLAVDKRSAQVFSDAGYRLLSFDCREESTCHAKGQTPEFGELVAALHAWLLQRRSVEELVSAHPGCEIQAT